MKGIEVHPFGGASRLLQMGQKGWIAMEGGDLRLLEGFIHLPRVRRQVELKDWKFPVFGR